VHEDKGGQAMYMVLECCENGDLFEWITSGKLYEGLNVEERETRVQEVMLQAVEAVRWCHEKGVAHRDVKPENLMVVVKKAGTVSNSGQESEEEGVKKKQEKIEVRLGDFGLATDEVWSVDRGCGSAFYISPECQPLEVDPSAGPNPEPAPPYRTTLCDIWSLGILLINLVCQQNPWHRAHVSDPSYRYYLLHKEEALKDMLPVSKELAEVLASILEPDPEKRATLSEMRERIRTCKAFSKEYEEILERDVPEEDSGMEVMNGGESSESNSCGKRNRKGHVKCAMGPRTPTHEIDETGSKRRRVAMSVQRAQSEKKGEEGGEGSSRRTTTWNGTNYVVGF